MKNLLDNPMICGNISLADAGIAHPVERHLAKVEVASSSLVARSIKTCCFGNGFFSYAGMVELADTLDLGSSGQPCRFKSCYPHHVRRTQLRSVSAVCLEPRKLHIRCVLLPFKIKTARPLHASCKLRHAAVLGFDFGFPGADSIYTQNRSGASYPRSCSLSSSMLFSA